MKQAIQIAGIVGAVLSLAGAVFIAHQLALGYVLFIVSCAFLLAPLVVARPFPWGNFITLVGYLVIDVVGLLYWLGHPR